MEGWCLLQVSSPFFIKTKSMQITSSPNIATLDSLIIADLCEGNFLIDLTPSVWIGTGYNNVLGSKIQVTNPYGVVVRAYPDTYDAAPAFSGGMDIVTSIPVPLQANNYQYGKYTIAVQLTDADGTNYTVTKTISICAPNTLDSTKKYGSVSAKLTGVCNAGKVYVLVDNVPTYKGIVVESTTQSFTLDYPTGSGLSPIEDTPQGSFAVQLFEGVYKIEGSICATYNYGDNVYAKVNYKVNYSKSIICSLDDGCVFTGLDSLAQKLNSDCSEAEKRDTQSRIEKATLLLDTIDFGIRAGEDISDYIFQLEDALGLTCSCAFDNGTPIINTNPSDDILIQGCNVDKEVVGLTTVYTINNYSYNATVTANGGALSVSSVVLNGCVQSQNFTFNITAVYSQVKQLASASLTEAQAWAAIVKKALNSIDASCLDLTSSQLTALTLDSFLQKIIDKACAGAGCSSTVDTISSSQSGADVIVSWTQTGAYALDIYVDGIFIVTVLDTLSSYTLADYADGLTHTYRIVSKCSNGVYGTSLSGTFGFAGCPVINAPVVSMNSVSASCPYDLTGLVSSLPSGITAEWHTANNHLASSLVPNENSVTDGVYYVFATNGENCYSTGVKVVITCTTSGSCSAPQNLTVVPIIGGNKVSFQSAAYPPPSNSYTLKRKVSGTSDTTYVTLATPTFNSSTGRWETTDTTAASNTLYVYNAISNCGTTSPNITLETAKFTCPTLTLTSDNESIGYSFVPGGGSIDKYEVELWTSDGSTLVHTDTHLPSIVFPSPITGSFNYLDAGAYKVRIVPYIGTYSSACSFVSKEVVAAFTGVLIVNNQNGTGATIEDIQPSGWTSITGYPVSDTNSITGTHGDYSGSLQVVATVGSIARIEIYKNDVLYLCSSDVAGLINFDDVSILESDKIEFILKDGDCV